MKPWSKAFGETFKVMWRFKVSKHQPTEKILMFPALDQGAPAGTRHFSYKCPYEGLLWHIDGDAHRRTCTMDGKRLNPRTSMSTFAILLHCCRNLFFSHQFQFGKNTGYGDGSFHWVSGPFIDPFLSGVTGLFLSKCVTHARFVKVAWTLRGIPF